MCWWLPEPACATGKTRLHQHRAYFFFLKNLTANAAAMPIPSSDRTSGSGTGIVPAWAGKGAGNAARVRETDSNYGVIFSWWDRLFGTYVAQPRNGHTGMVLGLLEFRDSRHQRLPWMLACPFLAITRQQAAADQAEVTPEAQE